MGDGPGYAFAVARRRRGRRLVGGIALSNVVRGAVAERHARLLDRQAAGGRGHATAAVRLASAFAFEHLGLHRRRAGGHAAQRRSNRVVEKAGFRREGLAVRYLRIAGVWEDHDALRPDRRGLAAQRAGRRGGRGG